jgi:hypothetical protein
MADDATLRIEIKNRRPVEVGDFTSSLQALAEEFKSQIEARDPEIAAADVRLYVKEVRTGSIIAELVAIAPQTLQLVSYTNAVVGFYKHMKSAYDWLSGDAEQRPALDKQSLHNLSQIVEPVAKESGSQINIGVVHGSLVLNVDSQRANAIQNRARKELEALAEPSKGVHEKVLLRWYQARGGDVKSKAGDRAIIESVSKVAVKTICANDAIKSQMILEEENPFREAYIVDVMVDTINGKPALYKILAVHDKFEPEG